MDIREQVLKFLSRKLGVAGVTVMGILYLIPTPEFAEAGPALYVYAAIVGLKIIGCTVIGTIYVHAQASADKVARIGSVHR